MSKKTEIAAREQSIVGLLTTEPDLSYPAIAERLNISLDQATFTARRLIKKGKIPSPHQRRADRKKRVLDVCQESTDCQVIANTLKISYSLAYLIRSELIKEGKIPAVDRKNKSKKPDPH